MQAGKGVRGGVHRKHGGYVSSCGQATARDRSTGWAAASQGAGVEQHPAAAQTQRGDVGAVAEAATAGSTTHGEWCKGGVYNWARAREDCQQG